MSLRRSVATAAIPWSKVRSIYRVLFRGDRHAYARDDNVFPVFASMSSEQTPGRVDSRKVYTFHFGRGIAAVATLPRNDNEKTDCRGRCAPRNDNEKTNCRGRNESEKNKLAQGNEKQKMRRILTKI